MKKILLTFLAAILLSSTANAQFYTSITGSAGVPTVSSCGIGASVSASSIDHAGKITMGTGAITSCTLNFSSTLVGTTRCTVYPYGLTTAPLVASIVASSTGFTITFTSLADGATIDYSCFIN